jgi:hypothetical protein
MIVDVKIIKEENKAKKGTRKNIEKKGGINNFKISG